ncbi:MAG TPA: asparagine synthase (glutamine-hydrolyzing) [Thiothrix sp.]|nr:asparagine synthase (glutamine-hydrolyzing) [Thiothrix sp.]
MCGFCGFVSSDLVSSSFQGASGKLIAMMDAIHYRGPDDRGKWLDERARLALGHQRLSIQDISVAGHQPMHSANERYTIVFNGEVYNFLSIRDDVEQAKPEYTWRGHSDTEVMLAAFEQWGIKETLTRMVGMFAFALYDRKEKILTLARDRMGEKPLYYGWQKGTFLFGSELKALCAHDDWQGEINRDVIALYLRHNNTPQTTSIYKDIYKLMPGCFIQMALDGKQNMPNYQPALQYYWSVKAAALAGATTNAFTGTPDEAVTELDTLLRDSIHGQMIADVPLGAFLSGGVDSSTVVALMQDMSQGNTKTFSIGFNEAEFNEANHAKAVAEHLGTDHTEMYVFPQQAMDVIPRLPTLFDEPFADPSQIPTFLVAELAKKAVTVSLSGDGGDELFCGYSRYHSAPTMWSKIANIPLPLRVLLRKALEVAPVNMLDFVLKGLNPALKAAGKSAISEGQLKNAAVFLQATNVNEVYRYVASVWKNPESLVKNAQPMHSVFLDDNSMSSAFDADPRRNFMYLDQETYLPDDILVKVDRCAMAVSLEGRIPLLDHRIVEFAWSLPTSLKMHEGKEKWPLRQILYQHVPAALIDRPKMGFGVPIDSWLRGPLRDWGEELLNEQTLKGQGFFHEKPIRKKWQEHISGKMDWSFYLWHVLMFQQWYAAVGK